MFVDDVDEGLEVAAGGVVLGVVLHFTPGGEEHEFGVGGAAAVFEVAGGRGEVLEGFAVVDEGDASPVARVGRGFARM